MDTRTLGQMWVSLLFTCYLIIDFAQVDFHFVRNSETHVVGHDNVKLNQNDSTVTNHTMVCFIVPPTLPLRTRCVSQTP